MDQRGASILCCGLPMPQRRNTNDDPSHLGTRASGPQVRRMVGTHWEAISAVMVRETLAGKVCVSAMSWNRVATVSALVLRSTPGRSHLSPCAPFLFHAGRGREHVGRGVNVTHPTRHGQRQALPARQRERIEEQNVGPPMQWLHRHGTFSIRNPGF